MRSTIIYFINGIDLVVPSKFAIAYIAYIIKYVWWGFVLSLLFTGLYSTFILLVSVFVADFKFFTDLIEVKEFMEESD